MERAIKYVEPSNVLFKRSQPVRQMLREDNQSVGPRAVQKIVINTKAGANGSFKVSQTRHSKRFRRVDITKNNHVSQKKEINPSKKDKEWLLEFCHSLQESALKALRLSNEKCTLAASNFKRSSNIPRTRKSGRRNYFGEPKQTYVKFAQTLAKTQLHEKAGRCSAPNIVDQPPAPPPRNSAVSPTPPPRNRTISPTPALKSCSISPAPPPRSIVMSPASPPPPKINVSTVPPAQPLQQPQLSLLQQFYSLNLEDSHQCLPPKYRYSPSSGYYSCSNSVGSCSPLPPDSITKKAPVIMATVKSTQVTKPQLQTAIALDNYIVLPPPPYRCSIPVPLKPAPSPRVDPPSYSSTLQSMAATQSPDLASKCSCVLWKPPVPLPQDESTVENETNVSKVDHQSPIPERKCDTLKNVRKLRHYSPQEFKFFMEQHIENLIKLNEQRRGRRMKLEEEMQKLGLSAEAQCEMRKMLHQKETNYLRQRRAKMNKSMFERIDLIGVGAFGEVTLVRKVDSDQLYAMKTLRKADVLRKKQVAHVKAERDILAEADNEWVVKLYFSFQDVENLYFVMEYIPGGDLMSLLIKFDIFKEEVAKFYLAELTCAVESVHMMGFIHRDIKPDNVLIDRNGHIKLTDFGLCTGFRWTHNSKYYEGGSHCRQDSLELTDEMNCKCSKLLERRRRREHRRCLAHSLVGTPNYIAPEVLLRIGYTQLCDWWSVGVVLYEMLIGRPPFDAKSPTETQNKIKNWENTLMIPAEPKVSPEAIDLILKLCTSPEKRLGKNASEIKEHPFLADIDFKRGVRQLTPPFIPKLRSPSDTSYFDQIQTDSENSFDSMSSSWYGDPNNKQSHGFFEFTFRRFFDDCGGVPFQTKMGATPEATKTRGAIYV